MAFDRAKELERRITRHMQRCIHFTGIQHKVCEAGVNYDEVRKGGPLPCLANEAAGRTFAAAGELTCAQRRWTTREEAEAEVREADEAFQRVNTCLKAIREKHGKARGLTGDMPCPVGCGGTLRYSIAGYNGHVHGQCSTPNCASWMQ